MRELVVSDLDRRIAPSFAGENTIGTSRASDWCDWGIQRLGSQRPPGQAPEGQGGRVAQLCGIKGEANWGPFSFVVIGRVRSNLW